MLRAFVLVVKTVVFGHLFPMLDVMREREPIPDPQFSPREFRAIVEDFRMRKTPENLLAVMLAVGTGRFPRIEFDYDS